MQITVGSFALALLMTAGLGSAGREAPVHLRYGFRSGDHYTFRSDMRFFNGPAHNEAEASEKPMAEMAIGVSLTAGDAASSEKQTWTFSIDTIGMGMEVPGGGNRSLTFEQLKGKSVRFVMDDRGRPASVQPDDPSTLNQTKALGFEPFSRDLLNILYAFPQMPAADVTLNEAWRFSETDTNSRGGQQVIVTRTTACKLVGTEKVDDQMCNKISYTVESRIESQAVKGRTTATGVLLFSERGIPIESMADIKVVLSARGNETIQHRTVRTRLE